MSLAIKVELRQVWWSRFLLLVPLGSPGVAVDELLKCVQGTRQKAVQLSDEAD